MKFLKKLFKRSSNDDDDDEFDDDDFDFDDDDDESDGGGSTTVIMDDDDFDDDLSDDLGDDLGDDDISGGGDGETGGSIQDDQLAALEAQMAADDDELFGSDSEPDGDGPDVSADDDDINFDDDEFDYDDDDWDDEDEDGEAGGDRRKKLIFAAAAVGVLVLGVAGGAAFWMMGDDEQAAEAPPSDGRIQMALPPKAGSLNAVETGDGETPAEGAGETSAETLNSLSGEQPADAAAGAAGGADTDSAAQTEQTAEAGNGNTLTTPDVASGSLNALAGATGGAQGLVIPSVTSVSYQRTSDLEKGVPLASAPIKALLETIDGQSKPLPKIDSQGRKPWEAYARPLTGNEQGQHVAIMVTGLGLSRAATMAAIRKLPPEVSLVFEPYASDLEDWLLRSRLAGHEVFVSLPMESGSFPNRDAGPLALTTTVQVADNMKRLHSVLGSFGGYVGVVSSMGSKFSTADGQLKPILEEIKRRGLVFVDAARSSKSSAPTIAQEIDLPVLKNNVVLDDPPSSGSIQRRLRSLESFISQNATAIATVRPYPVSIHQVQAWIKTLAEKKLVLVPVSSVVGKQFIE